MSAQTTSECTDRTFCPAVSRDGRRCDFAEHPGAVHWSWVEGELQFWQALPGDDERWSNQGATEDPLRDAPRALLDAALKVRPEFPDDFNPLANIYAARETSRGPQIAGVFVDEFAHFMELSQRRAKETEMWHKVQDLLTRGQTRTMYDRPLVEAVDLEGRFAYGLLETCATSAPAVHETVPESGGVPNRVLVHADTIREVFVPGHRGDCAGDCCREGYSEETSYPECWTWDQVRTGVAAKYRAWKDWVL